MEIRNRSGGTSVEKKKDEKMYEVGKIDNKISSWEGMRIRR
jgi:hypothetical protein